jgi:hypothetical protein
MSAPALAELHEIFLGQLGVRLSWSRGKHYRGDTASAEVRKDGSLAVLDVKPLVVDLLKFVK